MTDFVNNGSRSFELAAGASITFRQGSPGAIATIAQVWSDGATGFTSALLNSSTPVTVGPLAADARLACAAQGIVAVDVGGAGGGGAWGSITGTLSAQTDLQTALNAKANALAPLVIADVDFTANNINITKAMHLNRLILSDKTTAGTLTIQNDATSGDNAHDDALLVYQRGAGVISIVGGTGTVINAQGAAAPIVLAKGQFAQAIHTVADTMTSDAALQPSKFDFALSSPTLLSYRQGSITPTNIGIAPDNPLGGCAIAATTSTADGSAPFSYLQRGRFTQAASTAGSIAGYDAGGTTIGRMGDLNFWPAVVTASIDDASPSLGGLWFGLSIASSAVFTTGQPSASAGRKVGFGMDESDANLNVWATGTAGNSTKTDLGANFARAQFQMFIAVFWGDATNVYCQVMNHQNGAISPVFTFTGTTAPTVGDILRQQALRGNVTNATFAPILGVSIHSSGKWQGKIGL